MRNLTEEQTKKIANRLGISEPTQPKEVADYLNLWERYEEAVNEYSQPRLNAWERKIENVIGTLASLETATEQNENITALGGELIELEGSTASLASKAWRERYTNFARAIENEHERPQREFDEAKREFVASLEKETRSLKNRITRGQNKAWELEAGSAERAQLENEITEMSNRQTQAEYLAQEARYVYLTPETPIFTEEAVISEVLSNEYRVSAILDQLTARAIATN
jgi:hypothetical protein